MRTFLAALGLVVLGIVVAVVRSLLEGLAWESDHDDYWRE